MILPRLRAESQVRPCEGADKFRYQFFNGIGVIAEALA